MYQSEIVAINKAVQEYAGMFDEPDPQTASLIRNLANCLSEFTENEHLNRVADCIKHAMVNHFGEPPAGDCPECGSRNTGMMHFSGNGSIPEADYKECFECSHQWDHS